MLVVLILLATQNFNSMRQAIRKRWKTLPNSQHWRHWALPWKKSYGSA